MCGRCGATYHGDIGGRNRIRRMRHKGDVACDARRMFKAALLEEQLGAVIADRFALPDDWLAHYEQLLDTPVETPDQSLEMRRLRQAKARLDDIYPYSDMTRLSTAVASETSTVSCASSHPLAEAASRCRDTRRRVPPRSRCTVVDPATTDEHRKRFVQTVIEEIRLDDHGVAAVRPRDDYAPLVAIAEASGGLWSGWADSNCRPHGPKPRALPG